MTTAFEEQRELCDLYDRDGNPTGGIIARGEPVPAGLYRMVAGVLCIHVDGDILLMQRHPDKPTHPGKYEASASGSVLAGETAAQAAIRELREETGLDCETVSPLYEEADECRLYRGFLARVDCDKNSIHLQPGETVAFCWVTKAKLAEMLHQDPSPVILHQGLLRYLGL